MEAGAEAALRHQDDRGASLSPVRPAAPGQSAVPAGGLHCRTHSARAHRRQRRQGRDVRQPYREHLSQRVSAHQLRQISRRFGGADLSGIGRVPGAARSRPAQGQVRRLRVPAHLRRQPSAGLRPHAGPPGRRTRLRLCAAGMEGEGSMLSVSNLLCDHRAGNEALRYGHVRERRQGREPETTPADPFDGAPRPVVVWAVTKACNLRCVHCYASASPEAASGELTHQEGLALLEDLRAFNVPAVLFSGGEPLARPDTPALIAYAQSLGLSCTLSTNGLLIDEAMADRLAALGLKYAGISVDGIRARHDKLRGLQGAFEGTLAAIDRCRARGIKVGLRFTVHALNQTDLDAIFDICLEHDVQRLCVYHLAYAGAGARCRRWTWRRSRRAPSWIAFLSARAAAMRKATRSKCSRSAITRTPPISCCNWKRATRSARRGWRQNSKAPAAIAPAATSPPLTRSAMSTTTSLAGTIIAVISGSGPSARSGPKRRTHGLTSCATVAGHCRPAARRAGLWRSATATCAPEPRRPPATGLAWIQAATSQRPREQGICRRHYQARSPSERAGARRNDFLLNKPCMAA